MKKRKIQDVLLFILVIIVLFAIGTATLIIGLSQNGVGELLIIIISAYGLGLACVYRFILYLKGKITI